MCFDHTFELAEVFNNSAAKDDPVRVDQFLKLGEKTIYSRSPVFP